MADKYKIQHKGGHQVVITLDSSDDTVLGTRKFNTRELSAVSEGGAVNLISLPTNTKVFIGLDHAAIYKADGTTLWGSDLSTTVSNLNDFFDTTPHKLEDLDDVPAPTNGRFLKYSSDSYSWEEASGGDAELESAITISNSDAAFSHMTTPITAGTSLEAVLRDMLEKYNVTSITLSNLSAALETTTADTYGSYANSTGATLEVGQGLKIQSFNYSVADSSQTSGGVTFRRGTTDVESGISDTGTSHTLASVETQDLSSAGTRSYSLKTTDSGGDSDVTITSSTISFNWRFRVKVGASSTSELANDTAAQTLYEGVTTTGSYNNLKTNSQFTVDTSTAMNTAGNYTYIIYPASFTAITSIIQGGSIPVLGAFTDLGDFTITNQYGASVSYSFYRSNTTQAFSNDTDLKITF